MLNPELNRLLVIDDSADDHFLFCAILRRAGITNPVDWVSSAEDAMHYLDGCLVGLKQWPSVVFLDIKMPMIDGFELLEWARQRGVSGRTVIAMMSTSVEASDVSRAFALGAHSYVAKTGKPGPLIELVRTASLFASPAEAVANMPRWLPEFGRHTSDPFD